MLALVTTAFFGVLNLRGMAAALRVITARRPFIESSTAPWQSAQDSPEEPAGVSQISSA